jgi:hypothetical protein
MGVGNNLAAILDQRMPPNAYNMIFFTLDEEFKRNF